MDKRCPRKLEVLPDAWCPLAVQRLKAQRHADHELTEEEEAKLPGCKFAVASQTANYCFFRLIKNHMPDSRQLSSIEIAHLNGVSVETVHKIEKKALVKIRQSKPFEDIDKQYDNGEILSNLEGMSEFED